MSSTWLRGMCSCPAARSTTTTRPFPLDADLYGLKTEIHFEPLETRISQDRFHTITAVFAMELNRFPTQSGCSVQRDSARFSLDSALLKVDLLRFRARPISPITAIRRWMATTIFAFTRRTFPRFCSLLASAGDVSLSGSCTTRASDGEPFLRRISMDGQIASDDLTASSPGAPESSPASGTLSLAEWTLQARDVASKRSAEELPPISRFNTLDNIAA